MPKSVNILENPNIQNWINQKKPISWITKQLNCYPDTFKKYFPNYKGNQGFSPLRRNLPIVEITKVCANPKCKILFVVKGRKKSYAVKHKVFCSQKCSNSKQDYWNKNATSYKTIAKRFHAIKCICCGFDKIVAIHHYDKNHTNNKPENLIPLCPNHHAMIHHKKYKHIVQPIVDKYKEEFKLGQ